MPSTLYESIRSQRQNEHNQSRLYNKLMLVGYLHEQNCKRGSFDPQKLVLQTISPFRQSHKLTGYLYVKGYFYINIIESNQISNLNQYIKSVYKSINAGGKFADSHKQLRIVYQSYESPQHLFKSYDCDNSNQAAGPILVQTDKLEEQILDRSIQIYEFFEEGAKTKRSNPSHRISNMILLTNDDMSILISKHFMTINEYLEIYLSEIQLTKEAELNYPLPPNMFKMIEFMEINENYKSFVQ